MRLSRSIKCARGRSSGPRAAIAAAALAAACALGCGQKAEPPAQPAGNGKRLIVLGIDGMDPILSSKLMAEGKLPNLAKLAEQGTYANLGTSSPPESPVAWSDFITSMHSDGHGIFDFVHRDPHKLALYLSTSIVTPPMTVLHLGPWVMPIGGGKVQLLRGGRPFWSYLDDANIPATVLMIPAVYPPPAEGRARVIAGMGTPDLLGTYGVFQFYTTDAEWQDREVTGGRIEVIHVERGKPTDLQLAGPPDPFSAEATPLKMPFSLVVDAARPVALLRLGDKEVLLQPGEWSEWLPVAFSPGLLSPSVHGMVRVYLKSVAPEVSLYVTPLNIDPTAPATPFATPGFAESVAADVGRFYTLGIPEDEKALEAGALDDDEYLGLVDYIYRQRVRVIDDQLDRFKTGFFFGYVGTLDQLGHAFWRTLYPSDATERRLSNTMPDYYQRIDQLIGHVVERAGKDTPVIVMSDHGFARYETKVNLNTWLKRSGYLVLKDPLPDTTDPLAQIDWSRTRAYALGLNLLYLNLKGREAQGIVSPEERDALLGKIKTELEALRDPSTERQPVLHVVTPKPGAYGDRAPDAIIGYARGFRSSDASAVGAVSASVFEPNQDKWRGDHCMDAASVPGIIASTLKLQTEGAALVDVAPTVLDYFGVVRPPTFVGHSLLEKRSQR